MPAFSAGGIDDFFGKANQIIGQLTLFVVGVIGAYKWIRHEWNRRHD